MGHVVIQELKKFIQCPKCEQGEIIHNHHYFCNREGCDFWIPNQSFGFKINKSMMTSLIKNYILEPMWIGAKIPKDDSFQKVNAFLTLDPKEFTLQLRFPKELPIAACPKCKQNYVHMKYSERNDSLFYGCADYRDCKFTLPYTYANRYFSLKDIRKLCSLQEVTKELQAKKTFRKYTVNLFLNESFRITQKR